MRSICFFASFFTGRDIPYYVTVYLKELKKKFGEVEFLCSQPQLSEASRVFLKTEGIGLSIEKNEGFDFGLWYKAFQRCRVETYDQVALVNDSCILFAPLDGFMNWSQNSPGDLHGMTYSEAVAPHLQSYFLLIKKPALLFVNEYFAKQGILGGLSEVIRVYEVGMCSYLISKGLRLDAYVDNGGYRGEYSPYYRCVAHHLAKGIPLIKKKIIFSSYRKDERMNLARMGFNISVSHYVTLIQTYNTHLLLDLEHLGWDTSPAMSSFAKIRYWLLLWVIHLLRPFYKNRANA